MPLCEYSERCYGVAWWSAWYGAWLCDEHLALLDRPERLARERQHLPWASKVPR